MTLTIQLTHRDDADSLHAHAERVLRFALTRFGAAVTAVRLRLVDENGPRGGTDQRCRVRVVLRQGGAIDVSGDSADAHGVIYDVAARAARAVGRRIRRSRDRR